MDPMMMTKSVSFMDAYYDKLLYLLKVNDWPKLHFNN